MKSAAWPQLGDRQVVVVEGQHTEQPHPTAAQRGADRNVVDGQRLLAAWHRHRHPRPQFVVDALRRDHACPHLLRWRVDDVVPFDDHRRHASSARPQSGCYVEPRCAGKSGRRRRRPPEEHTMSDPSSPLRRRLFTRGSWPEAKRLAEILRAETVGGVLLLIAAGAAIVWANSPWSRCLPCASRSSRSARSTLHLRLTVAEWAADGLLAIFFFVVGLELKREFVAGDLRDPARAALPIAAAVGGMVVARGDIRRGQPRGGPSGEPRRLGGADRHRHRVRAGGAGGAVHASAQRAAHFPADAGRRRRPAGDHGHRRLLHR